MMSGGSMGMLLYPALALYAGAFVLLMLGVRSVGRTVFGAGFILSAGAVIWRGLWVGHLPLQNLFEVFLVMGALVFPVSWFAWRFLKVEGSFADALLGVVFLAPPAFVFSPQPSHLPPALQCWLFGPHVLAYLLAYVVLGKAGFQAVATLAGRDQFIDQRESGAYRMTCLGFPLLTLGLLLGAWWGKLAWGDYWNWDPKELWSLATWLTFLLYLHLRRTFVRPRPLVGAWLVLLGTVCIIITLLWVNLDRIFAGLHNYAA